MAEFLADNWGTLLVGAIVAGIIALVIVHLVGKKLKGERICSCGGSCQGCCPGCNAGKCPMKDKKEEP